MRIVDRGSKAESCMTRGRDHVEYQVLQNLSVIAADAKAVEAERLASRVNAARKGGGWLTAEDGTIFRHLTQPME